MSEASINIAASPALVAPQEARQPGGHGSPVRAESSDNGPSRGPDAIVELSPQAARAAQADSGTNTGENTSEEQGSDNGAEASRDKATNGQELTQEDQEQVDELKERDQEVRRHEQAHKGSAGSLAQGGPTFSFQRGPDGKQYAVGGEVQIDTSPVDGDPAATIRKMQAVRRAALSPAEPSSQDRSVAAQAARAAQQARQELREQSADNGEQAGSAPSVDGASGATEQTSDASQDEAVGSEAVGAAAPGSSSTDFSAQSSPGTSTLENQSSGRLLDVYV